MEGIKSTESDEVLVRKVGPVNKSGNTGRIYVPKKYIGRTARIEFIDAVDE